MSRVGVGVVGCGALASNVHLRTLARHRGAAVVALADPDPAALARARRLAPEADTAASLVELLRLPAVEAVVVATPTALHAKQALQVLAAGRHLYLEKPLATRPDEGAAVVAAGEAAGVVAAIGFNRRRHPLLVAARRTLDAGAVGPVAAALGWFSEPTGGRSWRTEGEGAGPLLDLASHHVDTLCWLLRDEPAWVDAAPGLGATATLRIGFAGGAVASLVASFGAGRSDALVLHGADGSLELDRYARRLRLVRPAPPYSVRVSRPRDRALTLWRARARLQPGHDPSYAAALGAWVGAIGGADVELPTLADGLRSLAVVAAAATGERVVL